MRTRCCRGRRISKRAKAASVLACCVPTIVSYEILFPRRHLVAVLVPERGAARPPNAACPPSPFLTPVSGQNPFTLPALAASFGLCCVVPLPLPTRSDCVSLCGSKRRGSKVAHICFLARTFTHSCHTHCWRRKHRRRLPLHHPNLYFMSTRESERMKEERKKKGVERESPPSSPSLGRSFCVVPFFTAGMCCTDPSARAGTRASAIPFARAATFGEHPG